MSSGITAGDITSVGQNVRRDKTFGGTKHLGGQNVQRDKTSGRQNIRGQNVRRDKTSGDKTTFWLIFNNKP